MLEVRWRRRLGAALAAGAVVLALGSTTAGAPVVEGSPPPDCREDSPGAAPPGRAWYRLDPILRDGARHGQQLAVGRIGGPSWALALAAESFATGPVDGRVVVGTDDGQRSTIRAVDTRRGCTSVIATSTDVIRRALLSPDGSALYEARVARADRADLGIWRRTPGHDEAEQVLPPIDPDDAFGITWATDLVWSIDGRSLAVASCGEVACRVRVLHPGTGVVRTVADPSLGVLLGVAGDRVVMRGACRGLPCSVVVADLRDGSTRTLVAAAGLASLVDEPDGTAAVVHERTAHGGGLRMVDLDGQTVRTEKARSDRFRPLSRDTDAGMEVPPGWLLLGPDGRLPASPSADARLHRLADGTDRRPDEVSP